MPAWPPSAGDDCGRRARARRAATEQQRIVVDEQHAQRPRRRAAGWLRAASAGAARRGKIRRTSCPRRARCRSRARAPCRCTMPYTIASPRPGAALALGGEERLEAAAARRLRPCRRRCRCTSTHDAAIARRPRARAQRERAALGHRIDRVEHEVGQRVAHLALRAQDRRQVRGELAFAPRSTTPRCCGMSLQRARVRSSTCATSSLTSTGASVELRLARR